MGVMMRADLTGNGHPIVFCTKGLDDRVLSSHPSKGNPWHAGFWFIIFYHHMSKNLLEIYFVLFIFLDYCIVWLTVMKFKTIICQSGITQKINISRKVALFSSLTLPYQNIFGRELWINSEAMNLPISFVFILIFCNFRETQAVRFKKCSESKPDVMFRDQTDVSTYLSVFKKYTLQNILLTVQTFQGHDKVDRIDSISWKVEIYDVQVILNESCKTNFL